MAERETAPSAERKASDMARFNRRADDAEEPDDPFERTSLRFPSMSVSSRLGSSVSQCEHLARHHPFTLAPADVTPV
jgi:hypothetical protein